MIKEYIKKRLGLFVFLGIALVLVIWGAFSIVEAKKNAITYESEYVPVEGNVDFAAEGSYELVAGSDKTELYYNEAKGTIQVKNLESGYIWKSVVDRELYDLDGINKQWSSYLQSILTISYNDLEKRDAPAVKAYSATDCSDRTVEYLDHGVAVTYGFTTPGIYVTVEYVLERDELVVRIPADRIQEMAKYAVTSMELMPYFGAAGNEVDGYLLYPDGSGAITTYENAANRPASVKAGIWRTYSDKSMTFESLTSYDNMQRYTAAMPIYGIKNGEDALLAAFTQGAENTGVVAYPSGYVVNLNHIGFEVYTRNVFDVNMFNVSSAAGETATGKLIQRVDKELILEDREVRYFLLSGEDADYSGMADTYRAYLLENGQIQDAIAENSKLPLALQFIMGVTKDGMVFDEYVQMTSFDNLIEIYERLKTLGVADTRTVLTSWLKDGENYPDYWPAARQLGGYKGLEKLNQYIRENPGNETFLENQFFLAVKENGGFSESKDVVYDGLNQTVTGGFQVTYYLLNPKAALERSGKFLDKIKKLPMLGTAYADLGKLVYPDYNKDAPFTRQQTVAAWQEMLSNTKAQGHKTSAEGLNQYTYQEADYLYNTNEGSYGLFITDASVPFVQMVISGLIPYSTDNAGNLSYDLEIQKLKWIEYGALPNFILTYEDALNLKDTSYSDVFTSTYDVWEERVVSVYKEFQENFQSVYGLQMTNHDILEDGLIAVRYENGTKIYLNYNASEAVAEGHSVPAKGYVIVEGGARE